MTAPNSTAVIKCIKSALQDADVRPDEIDAINGHLTATVKDPEEIRSWKEALDLDRDAFPFINSLKSMTGHGLGAAGSMECVASVLQIHHNFVFPSINCEDLHPEIESMIGADSIPRQMVSRKVDIVAKASFGFGDVNACVLFKKFK
jgi:3-oxoacyl-(acyl-carrier-protein) synthase